MNSNMKTKSISISSTMSMPMPDQNAVFLSKASITSKTPLNLEEIFNTSKNKSNIFQD